jgi:hypothetical protein
MVVPRAAAPRTYPVVPAAAFGEAAIGEKSSHSGNLNRDAGLCHVGLPSLEDCKLEIMQLAASFRLGCSVPSRAE